VITQQDLQGWEQRSLLLSREPVKKEDIDKLEKKCGKLPKELENLYYLTNGAEGENFRILPLFRKDDPKKTWDSLERANDINSTKFRIGEDLLSRFLVFGEIGGLNCVMYDRHDQSIWYEDEEGYHKTDLSLKEFIEGLVSEEADV